MLNSKHYKKIALERLVGNWVLSIIVTFIASLLGGTGSYVSVGRNLGKSEFMNQLPLFSNVLVLLAVLFVGALAIIGLVWSIIQLVVGPAVSLGLKLFYIKIIQKEAPSFSNLFSRFSYKLKAFILTLLIWIFTFLWTLLFVIPGIIASYSYSMAVYIMAENPSLSATECINRSKKMMLGNKFRLFCLDFSFVGWYLLCGVVAAIGSYFLATSNVGLFALFFLAAGFGVAILKPYTEAARAAFYLDLSRKDVEVIG